jgi:hypothetical protein
MSRPSRLPENLATLDIQLSPDELATLDKAFAPGAIIGDRQAVQNFQKFIVNEARTNGLPPERLGEAVHVALTTAKPKARYTVVPQRFKNWTLPRLLPTRMLDAGLAKQLGLLKR